jgi:hypothetical protein
MPIPTYVPGYPPNGSSLGQTKATIRDNLDGTFDTLAIDHINNNGQPGSNPAGYHKVIHIVPQGSNPGAVTGYGQLFSKTVNSVTTDEALFWETGAGLIQQLTVNLTPAAVTNGYTFLPGGLIMQWGTAISFTSGNTVSFTIVFPTACLNVQATIKDTGSRQFVYTSSYSTAGFIATLLNSNGSAETGTFTWLAIGN